MANFKREREEVQKNLD
jgi:hypothetical protein